MAKDRFPVTPAIRMLRAEKVDFSSYLYNYEEHGGTEVSARELGVEEHAVIKTLVMEDDQKCPLIVLMHGDMQVSTKELARLINVRQIVPCTPEVAQRHSGYMVGGTSPFGTRHPMPVYMEASIEALELIYINGGKRGYLVGIRPADLVRVLKPTAVKVGI
ncbi:MAG TPA: Cys-tRNA(Pro) deacylase [Deltaproteobacteria bacterium]|nr:Cys-tRNA(Pro) deacylase [Deltaproteobacteria bacterium]HQB39012.1 Cys-tRNA(Pro) deacylase [Deltaproteobacteria bacterium]